MSYIEKYDQRNGMKSIFFTMRIGDYLKLVSEKSLLTDEKMENQRKISFSGTKGKIFKKMVSDILEGGDLPPIILGLFTSDSINVPNLLNYEELVKQKLYIIDGQHRTRCLQVAIDITLDEEKMKIENNEITLNLLVSDNMNALFERMMVLNIGQSPWDTKQQAKAILRFYYEGIQDIYEDADPYDFMEHFFIYSNKENSHSYNVNLKAEIDTQYANSNFLEVSDKSEKQDIENFGKIYLAARKASVYFPTLKTSISKAFCYVIKQEKFNEKLNDICIWFSNEYVKYEKYKNYEDELVKQADFPSQKGYNRKMYSEFILELFFDEILKGQVTLDNLIEVLSEINSKARNKWTAFTSKE